MPGRGLWPRFLAGSLLIIVAMTTATAVSLLVYLKGIARGLGGLPSVTSQLEVADPGNPQTILILGSDERPTDESGRSDTTILLRVASDQITVMSIPRDLKVNIPGHGIDRFNAAYSYGGPKLALKVVKQLTGLDNINHVVNVDFTGFAEAVNAIDCVYVDVDHHYYHSNLGLAASEQYAEIDVEAGYQRMCGFNALQYVRYRHEDNDLVRAARQQEFLREARQQLPADEDHRGPQRADRHPEEVRDLGHRGRDRPGQPRTAVHRRPGRPGGPDPLPGEPGRAERVLCHRLRVGDPGGRETVRGGGRAAPGAGARGGRLKEKPPKKKGAKPAGAASPAGRLVVDRRVRRAVRRQAGGSADEGRQADARLPDPLPHQAGAQLDADRRLPRLPHRRPGDEKYRGYKIVASLPTAGYTAYYGVSGTDWKDPPILEKPSETRTVDGREYKLSWDGGRLRFVGWKTEQGSYWVDNTLLTVLTPGPDVRHRRVDPELHGIAAPQPRSRDHCGS